ncbi:hypothetical protein GUJ93_ZPchr0012g20201 [Zizania palustris]|uniref:Uncharacterized protein n=1 Tax=Zizania palustris TaxID=103762 RepID=A0A8J5WKX0_ZIZPA|nr:hypothetical protein GUJ93_ZPchr0012g20201 [Zizania palustris]
MNPIHFSHGLSLFSSPLPLPDKAIKHTKPLADRLFHLSAPSLYSSLDRATARRRSYVKGIEGINILI